ncbi:MAG TPA: hypothetical protein VIL28_05240 [Steroidobacteraceae bacterium]
MGRAYENIARWSLRGAVAIALLGASVAHANDFGAALKATKPIIDARLRFENVEQDPLVEESDANTLRLRLGFQTGKVWNTSLLAEGEFVWPFAGDYRDDNSVATNTAYPVVPDPEVYELNRLHLTNTALPGTTITVGRQRILLDDHRFVGNVGWRQNEQTFDAVRIVNKPIEPLTIDVTYLNRVNRVFGKDSPQGVYEGDGYLANLAYQTPIGKVTGFAYLLDFDPIATLPAAMNPTRVSTETFGVRFAGDRAIGPGKIAYVASYATQEEYGDNPLAFDLDYYLAEVTGSFKQFSLTLGQEVLEGDGTVGFATPLATLHRFNGWADKFLVTPPNGIDDRYVALGYAMKSLSVFDTFSATVAYHSYETERAALDLGDELNCQVQAKWQRFVATLKYADYDANPVPATSAYQDTVKWWAMIEYVW